MAEDNEPVLLGYESATPDGDGEPPLPPAGWRLITVTIVTALVAMFLIASLMIGLI